MAVSAICSIPDCGKKQIARGWCPAHYRRWRIHGSPTAGGTTPGMPMAFLNELLARSSFDDECLTWPFPHRRPYPVVWVNGKSMAASRYVCEQANGPPPDVSYHAAHECGNGHLGCVNPAHLTWKTPAQNKADELIHGTRNRGLRNGRAKLTDEQVLAIRAQKGRDSRDLAASFGITRNSIYRILSGTRRPL